MTEAAVVDGVVADVAVEMVAAVAVAEVAGEKVCTTIFNGRHSVVYILELYCMKLWKKDISHMLYAPYPFVFTHDHVDDDDVCIIFYHTYIYTSEVAGVVVVVVAEGGA